MPRKKKVVEHSELNMQFAETAGRSAITEPSQPAGTIDDAPVQLFENDTGARFLIYSSKGGVRQEVLFDGDQPWFTQKQLAEMFGVDVRTVSEHVGNFLNDGELSDSVIRDFRITAADSKTYLVKHYALDVAFYVGYRANSSEGILFRKWATAILTQFAMKGFVVDKPALKGQTDRIAELREVIRDLRSDEASIYAELRNICAMCLDYDPGSQTANRFYANMQAKLYWAVVSKTPSEVLRDRVDAEAENLGLQSWAGDHVLQADATTAKNTLLPAELKELNRVTDILLSVFEDQLDVGRLTSMQGAERLLDEQLAQLGRPVLRHGGSDSSDQAKSHVMSQYKIFNDRRKQIRREQANAELAELKRLGKPTKS